jgi:hypothetical protein
MEQTMTLDAHEFLYGHGHVTYRGLLGSWPPEPMPPETMTRQRRRAAERAAAKAERNNIASRRTIRTRATI